MKRYLLCLPLLLSMAFAAEPATPAAAPATPAPAVTDQPLFNGKDFTAWEMVTSPATDIATVCHYTADGVIACTGKPVGFLVNAAIQEKDYRLHVEWRFTQKTGTPNGGVLLHISSGPKDRQWPLSFQIQTKFKSVGDVLPMAGGLCAELPTPPQTTPTVLKQKADSEKPLGEWNACDIVCRGDTIEVTVNGVAQNKVTKCVPHTGKIGFQFEGFPFELRNVRFAPLN